MDLMNIKTALSYIDTFYGLKVKESAFEEIALNALELIGNKHTELREFIGATVDGFLQLPCDADDIEAIYLPIIDANTTDTLINGLDYRSLNIERYIDTIPSFKSPYYRKGKLVKYKTAGNKLQFDRDYDKLLVVYHSQIKDGDDLPLINDKEMRAIAAYVAYATMYKEGLMKRDGNLLNLANSMKMDWLQYCNAARVSSHISQNEIDDILDAKTSSDRKQHGKSFKIR